MNVPQTLQSHIPSWRSAISDSRTFNHAATDTRLPVQDSISTLARSKELSGLSLLRFPRVHTSRRLGRYAVERFCLMDRARVEARFLSFQKGATLRNWGQSFRMQASVQVVKSLSASPFCLFWIVHDLIPEGVISMLTEVIVVVFDFDKPCVPDFLA